MARNLKINFLLDTSAFLSLESVGLLKEVIDKFVIATTDSVIDELEDFARFDDKYGRIAKRVLKFKVNLLIKPGKVKERIRFLGETDNELFNLAKEMKVPLITDDNKIVHHTQREIESFYSTFFLIAFIEAGLISKKKGLKILERLRKVRNWESNIIFLSTKEALENI